MDTFDHLHLQAVAELLPRLPEFVPEVIYPPLVFVNHKRVFRNVSTKRQSKEADRTLDAC